MRLHRIVAALALAASAAASGEQLPAELGRDVFRLAIERADFERVGPREFAIDLSKLGPGVVSIQTAPDKMRVVDATAGPLAVRPWEYLVTGRAPGARPTVVAAAATALESNVTTVTTSGDLVQFEPQVSAANPLALSEGLTYTGVLLVGLRQVSGPAVGARLEAPLTIDVAGPLDDITPRRVLVDRLNEFQPVVLTSRNPTEPMVVDLVVGGSPSPSRVALTVRRPDVSIHASPSSIDGFGLGESTLTVRVNGLPSNTTLPVTVSAASGHVRGGDDATNTVDMSNGVASVRLRSGLYGTDVIQATTSVGAATINVTYDWPTTFLVAALFGGLLGARLGKGGVKTGVLAGLLAAASYAIGVSFQPKIPVGIGGAAATFVVAGLSGLVGAKAFR